MNSKLLTFIFLAALVCHAKGQENMSNGQYFQNLPVFSPALTGQHDFTRITTGYRQINTGSENRPFTLFLAGDMAIPVGNSWVERQQKRTNEWTGYESTGTLKNTLKVGLGGYLVSDRRGVFQEMEGALNAAVHVPVKDGTFLSLGISSGLSNYEIDFSRVTVRSPSNDLTYLSYLQNGSSATFFNIGSSLALYAQNYFVSYGIEALAQTMISGNSEADVGDPGLTHHILGGYTFHLNPLMELIPSAFLRIPPDASVSYDLNVRWRYRENFWAGISYCDDSSYLGMLGYTVKSRLTFGYAYGFNSGNSEFNNNSHELVFGVRFLGDGDK